MIFLDNQVDLRQYNDFNLSFRSDMFSMVQKRSLKKLDLPAFFWISLFNSFYFRYTPTVLLKFLVTHFFLTFLIWIEIYEISKT